MSFVHVLHSASEVSYILAKKGVKRELLHIVHTGPLMVLCCLDFPFTDHQVRLRTVYHDCLMLIDVFLKMGHLQ